MKKIFTLFTIVFISLFFGNAVYGQVTENFDGLSESSYGNYDYNNFHIDNGLCSSTNARTGNAVRLRNATSYLEYEGSDGNGKDGGVGTISFWYRSWDSSPTAVFDVKVNIDGAGWTNIGTQISTSSTTYSQWTHNLNNSNDNILIRVEWVSGERLHIDDFIITDYSASTNDMTSDVDGPALASQPDPVLVSSLVDTEVEAVNVFDFDVYDYGTSDGLSTLITFVTIKAGSNNDVDWSNNIAGVKLSTDGGTSFVTIGMPTISSDKITIPIISGDLEIADNDAETVSLFIYFKTSGLVDNGTLEFKVDATVHEFVADGVNGSGFAATFPGATSNEMLIDVEATKLLFVDQPTDTEKDADMDDVTVEATDFNGNRDLDFSDDISLSSDGTMTGDPIVVTASSGLATYSSIVHTVVETGRVLTAERDGTGDWDVVSSTFDILDPPPATYIIISKVADPDDIYQARFVEILNIGSTSESLDGYKLVKQVNGGTLYEMNLNDITMAPTDIFVIATDIDDFNGAYGCPPHQQNTNVSGNGDDGYFLKDPMGTIVDSYGVIGEDGTGTDWEYEDSKALRLGTVTEANPTWTASEWDITACNTSDFIPEMCNTIPIELNNFNASKVKNQTLVSWSTLTETNNDYFVVEWSKDGKNFEELGKVASKGTSREKIEYNYTHTNPFNGINYYRLAQYDLDGRSERFNVVSVYFAFDKENMIIVPNRIDNNLRIEFNQVVENGSLHIYNMEGKVVHSYILAKGIDVSNFDVSYLTSGQYIAKYVDTFGTITKKFIKL